MNNTVNAIEAYNICKSYKTNKALNNFNLTIPTGSFFAILGANGAGKSTFINILSSCVDMDSGSIKIAGIDLQKQQNQAKQKIGIVPQDVMLDPFFNTQEYLEFMSGFYGIKNNKKYIEEIMEVLDLAPHKTKNGRMLSGGMKRRLLIAKAIVHNPEIIVLDEPTAGVDIDLKKRLWDYMKNLNKAGKTIVLTTHYLEEAEDLCDRIAIVKNGEVIKSDTKQNLKNIFDKKEVFLMFDKQIKTENLQNILNIDYDTEKSSPIQNIYCYKCILKIKDCNPFFIADLCKNIQSEQNTSLVNFYIQDIKLEEVFREFTSK